MQKNFEVENPQTANVMMMYILIGLSLALAGIAGLQFFYLIYLERIDRERKKRIGELERRSKYLLTRLDAAERRIAEQNEIMENILDEFEQEEVWADVIEDR